MTRLVTAWFAYVCVMVGGLVASAGADAQCSSAGRCKCSSANGGTIDLSPLDNVANPMIWQQLGSPWQYQYNPCTGFTCGIATDMSVCEKYSGQGATPNGIGSAGSAAFKFDSSKGQNYVEYINGVATSKVYLLCNPNEVGKITKGPDGTSASDFTFELSSKHCCISGGSSSSGGLSAGSVMLIIFFSLLAAYLIGGVLFMHFVKHESGVNLIPNHQFWIQVPGQIRDGCVLTYSTIMTLINRARGNSGYEAV